MKRPLVLVVVALWLSVAIASLARAEPCARAHALVQGAPAPCAGDLLPARVVAQLLDGQTALDLAREQLANCADLAAIAKDEASASLEIERTARRACEASRTPAPCPRCAVVYWYEHPAFLVPATVVVTLVVVFAVGSR